MVWEVPGEKQDADPCHPPEHIPAELGQVCVQGSCLCLVPAAVPGVSLCHPLFIGALSQRAPGAARPQSCLFCCFPVRDMPAFPFFISCRALFPSGEPERAGSRLPLPSPARMSVF